MDALEKILGLASSIISLAAAIIAYKSIKKGKD